MSGKAIPMGKRRDIKEPYITIADGHWTTKVLKAYASDPDAPYARVYTAVQPRPNASWEYGDSYWRDITGRVIQMDPTIPISALPVHLRAEARRLVKGITEYSEYAIAEARHPTIDPRDGGRNDR